MPPFESCIVELEKVGFLKRTPKEDRYIKLKAGEWEIRLSHVTGANAIDNPGESATTDQMAFKDMLIELGVSKQGAMELASQFSLPSIQETIAYVDWLSKQPKNTPKNVPVFLVSAIRDGYAISESFRKRKESEGRKQSDKVKRDVERRSKGVVGISKPAEDVEIKAVRSHLITLSEEQASEFEAVAIMNGNCLTVATYRVASPKGAIHETPGTASSTLIDLNITHTTV